MSLPGLAPWDLLERLAEHLAGASTAGITQDDNDAWHEAQVMLTSNYEADHNAHLAFAIYPQAWVPLAEQREDDFNLDELTIDVRFSYRVRPDREPADVRLSLRAAHQLSQRVLEDAWTHGACSVRMGTKARLSAVADAPYVEVVQTFLINFAPGD